MAMVMNPYAMAGMGMGIAQPPIPGGVPPAQPAIALLPTPTQTPAIATNDADLQPPADLDKRNVIDKTADFVARNGAAFEHKILLKEGHNAVFSFLKPTDPFHAYYRKRVREIKGVLPGAADELSYVTSFPEQKMVRENKEEVITKVTEPTEQPVVQLRPPEPDQWVIDLPDIPPADLEAMRLTAQYVARNGKSLQFALTNRESTNPRFDFLKPQHYLHKSFIALVDSYTRVILPPHNVLDRLVVRYSNKHEILRRLTDRVEWERAQRRAKEMIDEEEKEREARALIDWHSFVIVETITFDDDIKPPAPALPSAPLPTEAEAMTTVKSEGIKAEGEGEDMDTEMDMDMEMDAADTEIKFRKEPLVRRAAEARVQYSICPKCHEQIPLEEMEEHMKIELLDPAARRKKLEQMKRKRESSLAEGTEVAANLKHLSKHRTDIFGSREVEIGKTVTGEEEEMKRAAPKVIWDGHTGSIAMTASAVMAGMSKEDLMARQAAGDTSRIGAALPSSGTTTVTTTATTTTTTTIAPPVLNSGGGLLATPGGRGPIMMPVAPMMVPGGMRAPIMPPRPGMPFGGPMMGPPGMMMPPGQAYPPVYPPGMAMHPQGMMPGMAPLPGQPEQKKQKTVQLIPEDEFLKLHPGKVVIKVAVPTPESASSEGESAQVAQWGFKGQTLSFDLDGTDTVATLKLRIKDALGGMPPNKQKLEVKGAGFLKDNCSLAYHNLASETVIQLGVKARGRGGKK